MGVDSILSFYYRSKGRLNSGKKILVVDDAAFMRLMLKDILVKAGHTVVGEAENGSIAVEKYKELKPDLVTMDITMPIMEGIEAVTHIKKVNPNCQGLNVFCNGTAGNDYKIDPSRRAGLHC
jgi:CheY-like chemotaxis protein